MLTGPNPRKRVLDSDGEPESFAFSPSPIKRHKSAYDGVELPRALAGECARLVTNDPERGKRALIIQLDQEFHIGRSITNDYRVVDTSVSSVHCRVYSLVSDTGQVLVCLEDTSLNGLLHNDRKVSRLTVVLCEDDRIEIGHQVFRFYQTMTTAPSAARDPTLSRSPTAAALELYRDLSSFAKVGNYQVMPCTLGSGAFATVLLAFNVKVNPGLFCTPPRSLSFTELALTFRVVLRDAMWKEQTLKQVACKKTSKRVIGEKNLGALRREIDMLKLASHPNINKIIDVEISDGFVHIFLELVGGGDLFSYLVKKGRLDAPEAKWIMYQVFQALVYLHDEINVAHRDIKLENVILCTSGPFPKIQLADFGQAAIANRDFRSLKGTLSYMAPEILRGWTRREGYDAKVSDIWSTGVLLSFLLTGGHPFEPAKSSSRSASPESGKTTRGRTIFGPTASSEFEHNSFERRLCSSVVKGHVALPRMKFGSHDRDGAKARNLLSALMNPDAEQRISARRAVESKWFGASRSELEQLYAKVVGAQVV